MERLPNKKVINRIIKSQMESLTSSLINEFAYRMENLEFVGTIHVDDLEVPSKDVMCKMPEHKIRQVVYSIGEDLVNKGFEIDLNLLFLDDYKFKIHYEIEYPESNNDSDEDSDDIPDLSDSVPSLYKSENTVDAVSKTTGSISINSGLRICEKVARVWDSYAGSLLANFVNDQRYLVIDKEDPVKSGIYHVTIDWAIKRADDLPIGSHAQGIFVFCESDSTGWVCINEEGKDITGLDPLYFTQFSGTGEIENESKQVEEELYKTMAVPPITIPVTTSDSDSDSDDSIDTITHYEATEPNTWD